MGYNFARILLVAKRFKALSTWEVPALAPFKVDRIGYTVLLSRYWDVLCYYHKFQDTLYHDHNIGIPCIIIIILEFHFT